MKPAPSLPKTTIEEISKTLIAKAIVQQNLTYLLEDINVVRERFCYKTELAMRSLGYNPVETLNFAEKLAETKKQFESEKISKMAEKFLLNLYSEAPLDETALKIESDVMQIRGYCNREKYARPFAMYLTKLMVKSLT